MIITMSKGMHDRRKACIRLKAEKRNALLLEKKDE